MKLQEENIVKTRMYSSRMPTARLLTIYPGGPALIQTLPPPRRRQTLKEADPPGHVNSDAYWEDADPL